MKQQVDPLSPLAEFINKTALMPNVWDEIMSNLTARDAAICLRVNKSLRRAVASCLTWNSKLRHKMDVSATGIAIRKAFLKTEFELDFDRDREAGIKEGCYHKVGGDKLVRSCIVYNNYYASDEVFAMDGVWYHRQQCASGTYIIKLDENLDDVVIDCRLETGRNGYKANEAMRVYPTASANRVYFHNKDPSDGSPRYTSPFSRLAGADDSPSKYTLAEIHSNVAKVIPTARHDFAGTCDLKNERLNLIEDEANVPFFLRYRIFVEKDRIDRYGRVVVMALLNDDGVFCKSRNLHRFKPEEAPVLLHISSREQVKKVNT